ncbi:histidine-rich glycoprotein [Cyrtonyx montezumae]|uniref:histidine-rich glycoprotein n=1 Tax=Cyrtonyx montezumae TaxID=9017 RepID=UPI0032D9F8B5
MLRLTSAFFLALLYCCSAQTQTRQVIAPADCDSIEADAGVALDLVNRHRQDGYVFGLLRVADAHKLHMENASILYLTLDVLETECSVLSGRPWETCEYGDLYFMDFGQCKIITYTSQLLKKPKLYGFNCTLSPVPPDLIECKDCPVKVELLEVTDQHKYIAAKLLEKFNREGNHTNYFKVNKVEKILKATATREAHLLGFSIKETNCSRGEQQQADEPLECEFLDDWHAHTGFCKARTVSDPDEPNGIEINCELYHPWQRYYGQRCRSPAPGWPHKHPHHHHHRHRHRHRGPPTFQFKPEDSEHNHGFNKDHQDSHEEPPPPCHGRRHHHPHPPPHDGQPPPPQEEPDHPSSTTPLYDKQHSPPLIQEKSDFPSSTPAYDEQHSPPPPPHHGPHCPPPHGHHHQHHPPHHGPHSPHPHGHHHRHHPPHHGPHCPPPHGHHHPPPPPHHGPHCPPPHGHHHPPPPPHHGPHCPPPHGHHHPPPPPHHGPHCPPPPPPGHHPYPYHHYHRHHCNKTRTSGKYFPFQVTGAVYRIPVLNMQDSLTPPSAKFPELSLLDPHSPGTDEGTPSTDSSLREMPEAPDFPDYTSQSKSCPGKPKLDLPKILPLFPHKSKAETPE